jgi:hypothetical protein
MICLVKRKIISSMKENEYAGTYNENYNTKASKDEGAYNASANKRDNKKRQMMK